MTIDMRSDLLARPTPAMDCVPCATLQLPRRNSICARTRARRPLRNGWPLYWERTTRSVFPTCTMANQVALQVITNPGDTVAAPRDVHILTSEANATAVLGGLQIAEVPGAPPLPPPEAWEEMARPPGNPLYARVSAFSVENTHNRTGGTVITCEAMAGVLAVARRHGMKVHLDGSRLFNAAVAQGCAPRDLAVGCDTVSISLNKSLGAPIAAALAGSKTTIARALRLRQRMGGSIRPTAAYTGSGDACGAR